MGNSKSSVGGSGRVGSGNNTQRTRCVFYIFIMALENSSFIVLLFCISISKMRIELELILGISGNFHILRIRKWFANKREHARCSFKIWYLGLANKSTSEHMFRKACLSRSRTGSTKFPLKKPRTTGHR